MEKLDTDLRLSTKTGTLISLSHGKPLIVMCLDAFVPPGLDGEVEGGMDDKSLVPRKPDKQA